MRRFKGFTIIELLVVIAVIGVLAVITLVAINPAEQLARSRDTARKSAITQMGHSLEAYGTTHNGDYVDETPTSGTWMTELTGSGELATTPSAVSYGGTVVACTTDPVSGWCYDSSDENGAAPVVLYTKLESQTETAKCSGDTPFFVWSSADGRAGRVCLATGEPTAGGNQTFVDD